MAHLLTGNGRDGTWMTAHTETTSLVAGAASNSENNIRVRDGNAPKAICHYPDGSFWPGSKILLSTNLRWTFQGHPMLRAYFQTESNSHIVNETILPPAPFA